MSKVEKPSLLIDHDGERKKIKEKIVQITGSNFEIFVEVLSYFPKTAEKFIEKNRKKREKNRVDFSSFEYICSFIDFVLLFKSKNKMTSAKSIIEYRPMFYFIFENKKTVELDMIIKACYVMHVDVNFVLSKIHNLAQILHLIDEKIEVLTELESILNSEEIEEAHIVFNEAFIFLSRELGIEIGDA